MNCCEFHTNEGSDYLAVSRDYTISSCVNAQVKQCSDHCSKKSDVLEGSTRERQQQ